MHNTGKKFEVKTIVQAVTGSLLLLASYSANSATIEILPSVVNQTAGNVFMVDIVGRDFTDGSGGSQGGGLEITWDNSIVNLQGGLAGLNITFPGDEGLALPPTLAVDSLSFSVLSFLTVAESADFNIATLTFDAVAAGAFNMGVNVSPLDVWTDSVGLIDVMPTGVGAAVTVSAVPVPAAVWLFGSGLVGLIGMARRRS